MVDVKGLLPGMRVKVVDEWGEDCYPTPDMTELLGQIVTIREICAPDHGIVHVEEDFGKWYWNKNCFDYIVDEFPDIEPANDDEVLSLIFA